MSLTATMFGVDSVRSGTGGLSNIGALVVVSGPEISNPVFETFYFDVDFTQTVNQIEASIAGSIRAAVLAQFSQTVPANGVNVISFTKG